MVTIQPILQMRCTRALGRARGGATAQSHGAGAEGPKREGYKVWQQAGEGPTCLYALPACLHTLA